MRRRAIGAWVLMIFALSILGLGQQLNPFTAVLKEPITRAPVKPGRNRVMLKVSVTESKQVGSTAESEPRSGPAKKRGHTGSSSSSSKPVRENSSATETAENRPNSTSSSDPNTVTLKPEESALDLRRNIGIKYQVLIERDGELHTEDPNRLFHSGESFRLKIESNINANLYLVAEDPSTGERQLLFPNYKFQRGVERVKPFSSVVVPPLGQPAFTFDNRPGEERIVVICSRDEIPALQLAPVESISSSPIKLVSSRSLPPDLEKSVSGQSEVDSRDFVIVSESKGVAKTGSGPASAVYVVNTNRRVNEEVVYVIRLKHGD